MTVEDEVYTALSQFLTSLQPDDTRYEEKDVTRELPFDGEVYGAFTDLQDAAEAYTQDTADFDERVTRQTLSALFEASDEPVTAAYVADDDIVSTEQLSAEDVWDDAYSASSWFTEDVPKHGKQYSYEPFLLVEDTDHALDYTALLVSAENHGLGCTSEERVLKLPSRVAAYTGSVDTLLDADAFVDSLRDQNAEDTVSYNRYEAIMDRLAADEQQFAAIKDLTDTYRMAREDAVGDTFYRDVPDEVAEQCERELVSRVAALGTDDDAFSYETVSGKLDGNFALFNALLDTDADDIFDLDDDPFNTYLSDNPDTDILSGVPGMTRDGRQFLSLFHPDDEPERELVDAVARCIATGTDTSIAFDQYIQQVTNTEPEHVSRTYW